jgi:hypothetical protein
MASRRLLNVVVATVAIYETSPDFLRYAAISALTTSEAVRTGSPVTKILADLQASMASYPNVNPGQDFDGYRLPRSRLTGN